MKKFKIFIIGYLIIAVCAIIGVFCYKNNIIEDELIYKNESPEETIISIKAKEVHDYIRENGYGYCTYDNRCNHDGNCGLNASFELSKDGYHNTCCATYVSWVLQEAGYMTKQEHIDNYLNGANNLINYLSKNEWKEVDENNIQKGDILCYNGHIAIYGGKGTKYDAGNRELIQKNAPCKFMWQYGLKKILRAPDL